MAGHQTTETAATVAQGSQHTGRCSARVTGRCGDSASNWCVRAGVWLTFGRSHVDPDRLPLRRRIWLSGAGSLFGAPQDLSAHKSLEFRGAIVDCLQMQSTGSLACLFFSLAWFVVCKQGNCNVVNRHD